MKTTIILFIIIFCSLTSYAQLDYQTISQKSVDSLISLRLKPLEDSIKLLNIVIKESSASSISQLKDSIMERETDFWKDRAFWQLTIIGGLLALTPLLFWLIQLMERQTFSKIKKLENEILSAKKLVGEYRTFQYYQEFYFEHVLKPTISTITDKLCDLTDYEKKITIEEISSITDQFYDFERVVDLVHYDLTKREQAKRYIENRRSRYLKVKLNSIVDEVNNVNMKNTILELLRKYS